MAVAPCVPEAATPCVSISSPGAQGSQECVGGDGVASLIPRRRRGARRRAARRPTARRPPAGRCPIPRRRRRLRRRRRPRWRRRRRWRLWRRAGPTSRCAGRAGRVPPSHGRCPAATSGGRPGAHAEWRLQQCVERRRRARLEDTAGAAATARRARPRASTASRRRGRGLWRGLWRWGGTTAATAGRGAAAATAAPARRWRWLRCAAAAAVRRAAAVLIPRPLPGRNAGACKNGAVLRATCVGHTASTMGEIRRVRVSEMLIVVGS